MRGFRTIAALLALAPCLVLAQQTPAPQTPPLVAYGQQGLVQLPRGWEACGTQPEGIRGIAPRTDAEPWSIHAPALLGELFEPAGGNNRPRPYQVYVRTRHATVQPLCMLTVLIVRPIPTLSLRTEETATGLLISLESEDFAQYPFLAEQVRAWLPKEAALAPGEYQCLGNRCTLQVPVTGEERRSLRARLEKSEEVAMAVEAGASAEQVFTARGELQRSVEVTVAPSTKEATLTAVLSADRAKRQDVKLPASLLACEAKNAKVSADNKSLTLEAQALRDMQVELKVVRTQDFASCPRKEGALDTSQLQAFTLHLLAPAFRKADLANPQESVALDWNPEQANTLLIHIRSPLLAGDENLHKPLRVRVAGLNGSSSLEGPCDATRSECTYSFTAPVDWKINAGVSIQLVAPTSDVEKMREDGMVLGEDVFWASDGLPLESGVPYFTVSRWLADRSSQAIALAIPPASFRQELIEQAITPRLARFLQLGLVDCTSGTATVTGCLTLEATTAPGTALQLEISKRHEAFALLLDNKTLKVKTSVQGDVTLVDRIAWRPISNPFDITVRKLQCDYELRQLTRAFEGMHDGFVYFHARTLDRANCEPANHWFVTTSESGVTLLPDTEAMPDDEVIAIHFDTLAALTTRSARDVQLSFFWDANKAQPAGSAKLRIEPFTQARASLAANVLSSPFGLAGAAPVSTARGAIPPLPMAQAPLLAIGRANWVRVDVPHAHNWFIELVGTQAAACHTPRMSERNRPLLPFREGQVCVVGVSADNKPPTLEATLVGTASEFAFPSASVPESLRDRIYQLGSQTIELPAPKPLRTALPLERSAYLSFASPHETTVRVFSHQGARAVLRATKLQGTLALRFPLSPFAASQLPATQASEEQKQRALALALEEWGPVEVRLSIETTKDAGATWAASAVVTPAGGNVRINSTADLTGLGALLAVGNQNQELELKLPFDPFQGERIKIEDYGEMRVGLQHVPAADRFIDPSTGAAPELLSYQGRLRWLNPTGPLFLLNPGEEGIGWRSRLSFALPVGVFRSTNTGFSAKTSSEYHRLETATFGLGGLYVFEKWDYNRNEADWLFNPQVHIGAFLNTKLADIAQRPRPSLIMGVGLRIPGGTAPTSSLEYSNGLILWGELTEGQRQLVQLSLLLGISVQLGSAGT